MSNHVRLLTPAELLQLVTILDYCEQNLPQHQGDELEQYITKAIRQNKTGELLLHEDEPWQTEFSYRYGAESVIGTAIEFLVAATVYPIGLHVEFIHDEHEQVKRGRDLRITCPTRSWTVSVKSKAGKDTHETRLCNDFFRPTYDPDIIAFGDFNTMEVTVFDYPNTKMLHFDNRTSHISGNNGPNDKFWYPPTNCLMKHKF